MIRGLVSGGCVHLSRTRSAYSTSGKHPLCIRREEESGSVGLPELVRSLAVLEVLGPKSYRFLLHFR